MRAAFDPEYGSYTFGKLNIMELRRRYQRVDLRTFHNALLSMGAPPWKWVRAGLAEQLEMKNQAR